ncbi:MAG: site-specific DNA-methyltransferase, partial [Planctomycetota bacterium]|nr:site-specific DNA-methyltransferase [Planctomycetota bacterium]
LTLNRLNFKRSKLFEKIPDVKILVYQGDARNLNELRDETVDLIATHPPYANIIPYSKRKGKGETDDLSCVSSIDEFIKNIRLVAQEAYRVLKPGKICAILIGDTRRKKHYVPISSRVMLTFLDVGFILIEDIIKIQHNCKSTPYWQKKSKDWNFHLIMHEHLFVFRKPESEKQRKLLKDSGRW